MPEVHALSDDAARGGQSVRVEAVVLYADPSKGDTITHDGTVACYNFVHFNAADSASRPKIGDRVLFEGFTKLEGVTPHIESQTWTILGRGEIPEPRRLTADEIYLPRIDVAWVEVPAVVIGVESGGIAYTLAVEVFGQTFKADVPISPDAAVRAAVLMQRPARMRAILGSRSIQDETILQCRSESTVFEAILPHGNAPQPDFIPGDRLKLGDEAVSDERDRMARDLHDKLEQQLAGVALQLDGLDKVAKVDPSQISSRLSLARRMLRHTRVEARRSVWDLRSKVLEIQGLGTALRSMAAGASSEEGSSVVLEIGELNRPLPIGSAFHLLRIAQEALANAIKHAAAREVLISIHETADAVVLTIHDDGQGFVPAPPDAPVTSHFGILGIHERVEKIGASLEIQSSPGHGCTVTVMLSNPPKP